MTAEPSPEPSATPEERVDDLPRILHEMNEAVRKALADHKRAGNPVAVWREGRVQWIPPEEIPDESVTDEGERDGHH